MSADHVILGVHVTDRQHNAGELQKVLTEFGGNIKTRLGLHETTGNGSTPMGLVLLEVVGDGPVLARMKSQLAAVKGLEVQEMVFTHR
jgi:hypothetical protein